MTMHDIVHPRHVALVTTRAEATILGKLSIKDNAIAVAWHMPVSLEPFLYAISVGKTRFSLSLLRKSGVFAINMMPYSARDSVVFCGSRSGEHIDKLSKAGLTARECEHIDCPAVAEASGILECKTVQEIDSGDHVILIGEVVHSRRLSQEPSLMHIGGSSFLGL
jgi:flavin reductase (DIM6/NTAB) family NADH-FMN oxidoreductase RutF